MRALPTFRYGWGWQSIAAPKARSPVGPNDHHWERMGSCTGSLCAGPRVAIPLQGVDRSHPPAGLGVDYGSVSWRSCATAWSKSCGSTAISSRSPLRRMTGTMTAVGASQTASNIPRCR